MTDNPITPFGDPMTPADTFIKKLAKGIAGSVRPWQILRVAEAEGKAEIIKAYAEGEATIITAQAEAEAAKIRALANIELQDSQQVALLRFLAEQIKQQENIQAIAGKAIPKLNPSAEPENMDDDWIAHFFDKSRLFSDEQMQELWAKILAGEANKPGSYSKRVVAAVSTLSKSEAESFNALCSFGWMIEQLTPLIYDIQSDIYQNHGVTFTVLLDFEAIGLISMSSNGFGHTNASQEFGPSYHGESVDLLLPPEGHGYHMNTGIVLLTGAGLELATLCDLRPIDGFKSYVLDQWKQLGYSIVGDDQDSTTD